MTEDEFWTLERSFWTGSSDHYETGLSDDALMVFPEPAGVLDRAATIKSIEAGPRWESVTFSEKRFHSPGDDTAILVYYATASRGNIESRHEAWASSVYVLQDGTWKLALHHQTLTS